MRPEQLLHGFRDTAKNELHGHALVANLLYEVSEMASLFIALKSVKFINDHYVALTFMGLAYFQESCNDYVGVGRYSLNSGNNLTTAGSAGLNTKTLPTNFGAVCCSILGSWLPLQTRERIPHQAFKRTLWCAEQNHRVAKRRLLRIRNRLCK